MYDLYSDTITYGSDNIFADIGLPDAGEMLARARLTHQIHKLLKERGLKQKEAAELLGLKQPDVSAIMNGKFVSFSLDRLLQLLLRLNQEVEIRIKAAPRINPSREIQIHAY